MVYIKYGVPLVFKKQSKMTLEDERVFYTFYHPETKEETTYNFEVEDNHNYYASEESILVHNDCNELFDPTANADKYVEYTFAGDKLKAFHQKSGLHKGKFISYDTTNHGYNGSSKFKLLKKIDGKYLELIRDLDEYGMFIVNKHSSNVGKRYRFYGGRSL